MKVWAPLSGQSDSVACGNYDVPDAGWGLAQDLTDDDGRDSRQGWAWYKCKASPGSNLDCLQRTGDGQRTAGGAIADTAVIYAALDRRRHEGCAGKLRKAT